MSRTCLPRPRAALAACAATALLGLGACAPAHGPADWVAVREITPAFLAGAAASDPSIVTGANGRVALTWVTSGERGQDAWLATSHDSGGTFGEPVRLNPSPGTVRSSPGSRPVAAFGPRGELVAAWSERRPGGGSDLLVRASGDGGTHLGPAARVNDDAAWDSVGHHGHAALAFLDDGSLSATWLEDRVPPRVSRGWYWRWWHRHAAFGDSLPAHQLMAAASLDGGATWSANHVLADSACACSRPDTRAGAGARLAVAYRRAAGGLRDPALVVVAPREVLLDTTISADGWRDDGCPADAPAIAWTHDQGGLCAWTTRAADAPGLYLAPWTVLGPAGARRPIADSLSDLRDPRLVAQDGGALLGVLGRPSRDAARAVVAVRVLADAGALTPWSLLGADAASPWLASLDGRTTLACWIERGGAGGHVRVARLRRR